MQRFTFHIALLIAFITSLMFVGPSPARAASGDMISTVAHPELCLTADGSALSGAIARMLTCRGVDTQRWFIDSEGKWHVQADATYCLALDRDIVWFNKLLVLPCTHSRVRGFVAEIQADHTMMYTTTTSNGTYALAMDGGLADGQVWLYYKGETNANQRWRWFQDDLSLVQSSGCSISYPVAAADTATYERELACDRVAKVQPPFTIPANALRDSGLFPGVVGQNEARVMQTFDFNLRFKNHDYLRMKYPPANWLNTGLYAPPNQIVRITVSNATTSELQGVAVQLGVHTDVLKPTSKNVVQQNFLRYPNVVTHIPLQIGENLVRSPYGGPIVLTSNTSVDATIQVTIADAIQAPYLKVGTTNAAEWATRRSAAVPYGSLESDLAVVYVPASELRQLNYEEATAVAQYYSAIDSLHNQLAGLSVNDASIHQPPQGKFWHVADKQITNGGGHSGFPMMYYNNWNLGTPQDTIYRSNGWGVYHELGHAYQMGAWSDVYGTEVTVNLFSLFAQEQLFNNSWLIDFDTYATAISVIDNPVITDKWNDDVDRNGVPDFLRQLVFLDQIRLAFPDLNWTIWTQLMRRYREMPDDEYKALNTDQLKRDRFMTELCAITNANLTPHFEAWTIPITGDAKKTCAAYPALTRDIWHIDSAQPRLAGAGQGSVSRSYWKNIKAKSLEDFTSMPTYPDAPTGRDTLTGNLESLKDWGDHYGERIRGYLLPPVTGDYRFWLSGDDTAQLRLSTSQEPGQATPVLTLTQWTNYREFDKFPVSTQRSQPVHLEAGKKYFFEVLHVETSGGDHVSVAWEIPASATTAFEPRKTIAARFLSPVDTSIYLPAISRP